MAKDSQRLSLKSLRLQNFATFENQELLFSDDFNALIGETGSGKSLILDALQLILGVRADKRFVRKNAEFASVEAIYSGADQNIHDFFNEIGYPFEGDEIVIKRLIYPNEGSKSYLNFQACPLHFLSNFAKRFIDLVGQFENQKLLSEDYQLVLLDNYCRHEKELEQYQTLYKKINAFQNEIKKQELGDEQKAQRLDYLKYQIDEIEKLSPNEEDEQQLIEKKTRILGWENRKRQIGEMLALLSEGENLNALGAVSRTLHLCEKDRSLLKHETVEKIVQAKYFLEEASYELSRLLDQGEGDAGDLEEILDRLDLYQRLKKKFGGEISQVLQILQDYQKEYEMLKNSEENIKKLKSELQKLSIEARTLALKIHDKRVKKGQELSKLLSQAVQELRMKGATLDLRLSLVDDLNVNGLSRIEFMAETNPGDGYFKVKDIASGGELSRILLALRQILSSHDSISIFLFDEIDTGIGGETALKIGEALKKVSVNSQVIAITHLPQIASYADKLLHVDKKTLNEKEGPRTISFVEEISETKKKDYIKAMSPVLVK